MLQKTCDSRLQFSLFTKQERESAMLPADHLKPFCRASANVKPGSAAMSSFMMLEHTEGSLVPCGDGDMRFRSQSFCPV